MKIHIEEKELRNRVINKMSRTIIDEWDKSIDAQQLSKVLNNLVGELGYHSGGFDNASYLHDYMPGVEPDADLVEIMEELYYIYRDTHHDMRGEYVNKHGIEIDMGVGEQFNYRGETFEVTDCVPEMYFYYAKPVNRETKGYNIVYPEMIIAEQNIRRTLDSLNS